MDAGRLSTHRLEDAERTFVLTAHAVEMSGVAHFRKRLRWNAECLFRVRQLDTQRSGMTGTLHPACDADWLPSAHSVAHSR